MDPARLRATLLAAGYTVDGVAELLGPRVHAALGRGETVPALRATAAGGPLATLVRLFLLGVPVPAAAAAPLRAVAPELLTVDGDEVRARLDVRPYDESWYVVSDLGPPRRPDHVLGVGGASLTLAAATVPRPVGTALDLGTGSGVQALHLSRTAGAVTATDLLPRALRLAALTAALSEVEVELLEGDLFAPVDGRRFDLVVSNPPFVIGPGRRFAYRDSGLPGDQVCRRLVAAAPAHLAERGWCQLLASWLHVRGEDWRERVAGWFAGTGCDAWVLQREVQDPAEHVELWLRDAGEAPDAPAYPRRYEEWLAALDSQRAEAVGFGIVTMRRTDAEPVVRVEDLRGPIEPPLGREIAGWFDRRDALRAAPLAEQVLRVAPQVRLERELAPGPDGWQSAGQTLRRRGGLHRAAALDDVGAGLLAGCDGVRPLGAVLAVAAAAWDLDAEAALPVLRRLVEEGFLEPVEAPSG